MKKLSHLGISLLFLVSTSGVCRADPRYPPVLERIGPSTTPTYEQKLWALATCAVLAERNRDRHDILGGCDLSPANIRAEQKSLAEWWNTHDREELLGTLRWIEEGGHRRGFDELAHKLAAATPEQIEDIKKQVQYNPSLSNDVAIVLKYKDELGSKSIAGWDFSRYVSLCGWAYVAGYLTEDEAWRRIMPAARLLQRTFTSWEDLGKNYVVGRQFWSLTQTQKDGPRTQQAYETLMTDPSSPWKRLKWNIDLTTPSPAKATAHNEPPPSTP